MEKFTVDLRFIKSQWLHKIQFQFSENMSSYTKNSHCLPRSGDLFILEKNENEIYMFQKHLKKICV
jgi:hypothetical protein